MPVRCARAHTCLSGLAEECTRCKLFRIDMRKDGASIFLVDICRLDAQIEKSLTRSGPE